MLSDLTLKAFLEQTAKGTPVPGGGSVAALSGAIGAGLTAMVANLTLGRIKYAKAEPRMQEALEKAMDLKDRLTAFIDKDSDAYNQVMEAFRMPKDTNADKNKRRFSIETAMKKAALVPMETATLAYDVMEATENVVTMGNPNAVTDGIVGVMMARTAALSALYNVRINLGGIKDAEFAKSMKQKADALEIKVKNKENEILGKVNL